MEANIRAREYFVRVRVGLPKFNGSFLVASQRIGAPILVSANSLFNHDLGRFKNFNWTSLSIYADVALDSAGFTAMDLYKGYPWSMQQYVDMVLFNNAGERIRGKGYEIVPWTWWAAMDFCCEPQVAANPGEVRNRMRRTVRMYRDTLEYVRYWRDTEGLPGTTDPMPTLQGWAPADYQRCLDLYGPVWEEFYRPDLNELEVDYAADIAEARDALNRAETPEAIRAARMYLRRVEADRREGLAHAAQMSFQPPLVGIGSVCRRPLHGDTGMLAIMEAVFEAAPEHCKFHFFGVKGAALPHIARHPQGHRIDGIDSLAWDFMARRKGREFGQKYSVDWRSSTMSVWYIRQLQRYFGKLIKQAPLPLWGRRDERLLAPPPDYPWKGMTAVKRVRGGDEEDE